jgi:hypothetical protein
LHAHSSADPGEDLEADDAGVGGGRVEGVEESGADGPEDRSAGQERPTGRKRWMRDGRIVARLTSIPSYPQSGQCRS